MFWRFLVVLGNKKQSQSNPILFSPQFYWGLKNQFEKTKPISNASSDAEWIPAFAGMTNMEYLHGRKF
jgi:hypothetical protein